MPIITSTIPSWMKYIFDPIVPSLMMMSPGHTWWELSCLATHILMYGDRGGWYNRGIFFALTEKILYVVFDIPKGSRRYLAGKLHTAVWSPLQIQRRGRRLWRKAQTQPRRDNYSWPRPPAAFPTVPRGSTLRQRIFLGICARNTCEEIIVSQSDAGCNSGIILCDLVPSVPR